MDRAAHLRDGRAPEPCFSAEQLFQIGIVEQHCRVMLRAGPFTGTKCEVVTCHQRSSTVISGHQQPSGAIRGHQRSSMAITSEVISGHG
jgi:hypothetical protein